MLNKSRIGVIGGGFAGLSAAAVLGAEGHTVHLFEKNEHIGGRARQLKDSSFTFDMGPSWYWMPDVLESFFNRFGLSHSDFFTLKKLDPGFQVIFGENDILNVPENWEQLMELFESIEAGAAKRLTKFMEEAEFKYSIGMKDLVYQPGLSVFELLKPAVIKNAFRLQLFSSFSNHVRKYFKHPKLIALMEFPVLFLGAAPRNTPALYSLMNYAGLKQGTFYPMGGFGKVIDAMKSVAEKQGVQMHTSSDIQHLEVVNQRISHIEFNKGSMALDAAVGAADYNHIEQKLLPKEFRNYADTYWDKKKFAPSCLLFYLGINKRIDKLEHHNLFFDANFEQHTKEIYETKVWPENPLFYVCCPSKTDPEVAPSGMENVFVLMPLTAGIEDNEQLREKYFEMLLKRIEKFTGDSIKDHVIFRKSYCIHDFEKDYNAFKGNAYGLANTLSQTANLRPSIRNRQVKNLFYAGQLTVPGPGVPPSVISGQVAANQLLKHLLENA